MKYVCIVVLQIILGLPAYEEIGIFDRFGFFNVQNSEDTGYDISSLVNQLNLQFCSIVEVGEGFCNMFVEFRSNFKSTAVHSDNVAEVYLGLCPCSLLKLWRFCGDHLNSFRPDDCKFNENIKNTNARVHRRLCDITSMVHWNPSCNCSQEFAGQSLKPVTGFKTCYRPQLPDSICSPRSVCGVSECNTKTLYQVHMVKCDSNCKGRQPFCEENSFPTTKFRTVHSVWTPWSNNFCNDTTKYLESESVCVDSKLNPAFDCLGPGIYCCPVTYPECRCFTTVVNNVLKVRRILTPCESNSSYYSNSMEGIADEIMYDINLITTNNSDIIREIYKKKRSVNLNDFWDVPNIYSFSKVSKIDRLEKSTVAQKQDNWEELKPKYSDPWNETLLITPSAINYNNPCITCNSSFSTTCKNDFSQKNLNFTNWMNNYINVYSNTNHNVSVKQSSNKVFMAQSQNKKNTSSEVIMPVNSMMKSINRLNTSFIKPQIIQKKNNNPNIYQRAVTHHVSYNKYSVNSTVTNHNTESNDTLKNEVSGDVMKLRNDKIKEDMKKLFPDKYKNIIDLILNNLTNHNNIITEVKPVKSMNTIPVSINTFNEINSSLANAENYSSNHISNRRINSNIAVIDIDPEKEIYKEIEISTPCSNEVINKNNTSYPHSYYDFIHNNNMLKKI